MVNVYFMRDITEVIWYRYMELHTCIYIYIPVYRPHFDKTHTKIIRADTNQYLY